jgi:hypothetical protein
MPDPTPRGLTLFFAIVLAIVRASFLNKIFGWIGGNRLDVADPFFVLAIVRALRSEDRWAPNLASEEAQQPPV